MNLFKAMTIEQFKIGDWLAQQGIVREDIARVELLSRSKIRIINPAGQYMDVIYKDGDVTIDKKGAD